MMAAAKAIVQDNDGSGAWMTEAAVVARGRAHQQWRRGQK